MNAVRHTLLAVGLLTRIPVHVAGVRPPELGAAVGYFTLVGFGLGAAMSAAVELLAGALPPPVVAVVLVAGLALVTGGLHLDGVADVFDGLGGGRGDRGRTLDIMRDSRIGAHGAVALVLVVIAKIVALTYAVAEGDIGHIWAFPVAARWAATMLVVIYPSARTDGLGTAFCAHAGWREFFFAAGTFAATALLLGGAIVVPALVAIGASTVLASVMNQRLDGLTGDVYGAAIEVAEIAYLFAALG